MRIVRCGLAIALACLALAARAQEFPAKPIRVFVPFAAGTVLETAVRVVSDRLRADAGQPLVVEARPGGGGIVAVQALLGQPADGYTLLIASQAILAVNPHVYRALPYDVQRDLAPITDAFQAPLALVAAPAVPATSLAELIAWAKRPGQSVSYGSFSPGTPSHFLGALINLDHGTDFVHVPYKGSAPVIPDLLGNRVQLAFLSMDTVRPHVESGKLRALAITSAERSRVLPNVPTVIEAGFPALEAYTWSGFVASARTPAPVLARLNALLTRALAAEDVRAKLAELGQETRPGSADAFAARIRAESTRWARAVKATGFSADQ